MDKIGTFGFFLWEATTEHAAKLNAMQRGMAGNNGLLDYSCDDTNAQETRLCPDGAHLGFFATFDGKRYHIRVTEA